MTKLPALSGARICPAIAAGAALFGAVLAAARLDSGLWLLRRCVPVLAGLGEAAHCLRRTTRRLERAAEVCLASAKGELTKLREFFTVNGGQNETARKRMCAA